EETIRSDRRREHRLAAFRGNPVSGPGRPIKVQVANKRIVVPFEENRYLTRLLGEYDSHLALIEDRLGIEAHAHGNVVTLNGPEAACEIARGVLDLSYKRASN